jgi:hypothetical protein
MTGRLPRTVFCTLVVLVAAAKAATVTIDKEQFFVVNGVRAFPFFFMLAPPPDARTPSGADAWRELKQYGTVFHHCNVLPGQWGAAGEARIDRMLARSAETGLLCAVAIRDLDAPQPGNAATESELRRVIAKYKDHPGLGIWKGSDEPEWGKIVPERCQRFYDIVHKMDPKHPVWLIQAPRGTAESLKRYDAACDIAGLDIYPLQLSARAPLSFAQQIVERGRRLHAMDPRDPWQRAAGCDVPANLLQRRCKPGAHAALPDPSRAALHVLPSHH